MEMIIKGKKYHNHKVFEDKKEATKAAKQFRAKNYAAQVKPNFGGTGYVLWIHNKKDKNDTIVPYSDLFDNFKTRI